MVRSLREMSPTPTSLGPRWNFMPRDTKQLQFPQGGTAPLYRTRRSNVYYTPSLSETNIIHPSAVCLY